MNRIQPYNCTATACPMVSDPSVITERYLELFGDESRLRAEQVASIYLPSSVAELCWAVQDIRARGNSCVLSAGRTGIAGGAVPLEAAAVISLGRLNRVLGLGRDGEEYYVRVEPGVSLAVLTGLLMRKDFSSLADCSESERATVAELTADPRLQLRFPVNPTEVTAHIGGIVATNASGARSYRYGATREWVRALTVLLADGRLLRIRRGEITADNGLFLLQEADGSVTELAVADLHLPATKATLGYPLKKNMDLIDLFIGSEGTLGAVVEVELRLAPRPETMIGVLVMVPDEETALSLVVAVRTSSAVQFEAIEYFDPAALVLLKEKKQVEGAGSHIAELPNWDGCAVYLELAGSGEETEAGCVALEEILASVGLSIDQTWAAMEPAELAAQRVFRHAVPEAVNAIIGRRRAQHPGLHKVGTDMAVPDQRLRQVFAMYRRDLAQAGIDSVVFGHIGDNHVHVNLLPRDMEELAKAKEIYLGWAEQVVAMGGAVAAEHGIGRMKKRMLEIQYPPAALELMRRVRRAFDPLGIFAPGVLFDR